MKRLLYFITPIRLFCLLLALLVVIACINFRDDRSNDWVIFVVILSVCLILLLTELLLKRFVQSYIRLIVWEVIIVAAVLGLWVLAVK